MVIKCIGMKNFQCLLMFLGIISSIQAFCQFDYTYTQISRDNIFYRLDVEPVDFDLDGDLDIVVSSRSYLENSPLSIMVNNGGGKYSKQIIQEPLNLNPFSYFKYVQSAFINQDELPDLIVYKYDYYFIPPLTESFSNEYLIRYINNGNNFDILDTLFFPESHSPPVRGLQLVDINFDNNKDLIICGTNLCVYSNAEGQLTDTISITPNQLTLEAGTASRVIDEEFQLITSNRPAGTSEEMVYVHSLEQNSLALNSTDTLLTGVILWYGLTDFNNNGVDELLYFTYDSLFIKTAIGSSFSSNSEYLYNEGSSNMREVNIINYNNDEYPDFVIGTDSIPIVLENINGVALQMGSEICRRFYADLLFSADLNDDLLDEIFLINGTTSPSSYDWVSIVQLSPATGAYEEKEIVYGDYRSFDFLEDLNSDGKLDVFLDNYFSKNISENTEVNYENMESLFKSTPNSVIAGNVIGVLDVNGDSFKDLIIQNVTPPSKDSIYTVINDGNNNFVENALFDLDVELPITIVRSIFQDFNNDGSNDLVIFHRPFFSDSTDSFFTVLSKNSQSNELYIAAKGSIPNGTWYPINIPKPSISLSSADIDSNGFKDIIVQARKNGNNRIFIFLNYGDFNFSEPYSIDANDVNIVYRLDIADINNDGINDIVYNNLAPSSQPPGTGPRDVFVRYGTGFMEFSEPQTLGILLADFAFLDINSDGITDLIGCSYSSDPSPELNWIKFYYNDGDQFSEAYAITDVYVRSIILDTLTASNSSIRLISDNVTNSVFSYIRNTSYTVGVYSINYDDILIQHKVTNGNSNSFVFPNPADDFIVISNTDFSINNNFPIEYSIIDQMGIVRQSGLISNNKRIDLKIPTGLYTLILNNHEFYRFLKK